MTFREFKQLDFPADMPMEQALTEVLYRKLLDVNVVLSAYTHAIDRDRMESKMRFEEACVCMSQHLGDGWKKGKMKMEADKRMVHIFNHTQTLPKNIYNEKYGYTEDDKKYWDGFYKIIYGTEL